MNDTHRREIDSIVRRLAALRTLVGVGMVLGVLLSWPLWQTDRVYPHVPLIPVLQPDPTADWGTPAALALVITAAFMAVLPSYRAPGLVLMAATVFQLLGDWTRWQPWVYQYMIMAVVLCVFTSSPPDRSAGWSLSACRVILVGTYCWSGVHKWNHEFHHQIAPYLLQPLGDAGLVETAKFLQRNSWFMSVGEVATGVFLAIPRTRIFGAVGATMIHGGILASLGPLGHHANSVVWPWNLMMVATAWLLAVRLKGTAPQQGAAADSATPRAQVAPALQELSVVSGGEAGPIATSPKAADATSVAPRSTVSRWRIEKLGWLVAVVTYIVLPAGNLVNRWDTYLSCSLYSGMTAEADIVFSPDVASTLPDSCRPYLWSPNDGWKQISLNAWAYCELNVPPYPEERVSRRIAEAMRIRHGPREWIGMSLRTRPDRFTGARTASTDEPPPPEPDEIES